MSTELARVQGDFQHYLLNVAGTVTGRVKPGGRIPADKRLGIYHNAYRVRLIDTLRDTYEKTWTYLGDTLFEQCASAYVEAHPPAHRSLRDYGAEMPDWLAGTFADDRDVAELALMDWQLRQAFDGADAVALQLEDLADLSADAWETLGFHFVPTLALSPLCFNTPAIWRALDQGQPPPTAQPLPAPAWLCVWRRGWQPHFRTLDEIEFTALSALCKGARFSSVCLSLSETCADASTLSAHYLRIWLTEGLIAGLTMAPDAPVNGASRQLIAPAGRGRPSCP
jgi:hypothetical protein